MRILKLPNLPDGRVVLAAVGERYFARLAKGLAKYGITPAIIKGPGCLPDEIRHHPDINLRHTGKTIFVLEGTEFPRDALERAGFEIKTVSIKCGEYPFNACLNAAVIGKVAIHNLKITAPGLKNELCRQGIAPAGVKQGYCACGAAVVDEGSIITLDEGISRAALSLGLDVLKITPGYIELPGYEYGFIGGCCGKISKTNWHLPGNWTATPTGRKYLPFLPKREFRLFLTDGPLFDAGDYSLCEV